MTTLTVRATYTGSYTRMQNSRALKSAKQAAKNLKKNQQYILVQDREAAFDIGGAPSVGIYIINIFLNIFSSVLTAVPSPPPPPPQSSLMLVPSARETIYQLVTAKMWRLVPTPGTVSGRPPANPCQPLPLQFPVVLPAQIHAVCLQNSRLQRTMMTTATTMIRS